MTKRIGGPRRATRGKFKKSARQRGKISITNYLREFKEGEKVVLYAEPAVQKGLYHQRHHGRHGIVKSKKGSCYEVLISDLGKQKRVIVHPVHLRKA